MEVKGATAAVGDSSWRELENIGKISLLQHDSNIFKSLEYLTCLFVSAHVQ